LAKAFENKDEMLMRVLTLLVIIIQKERMLFFPLKHPLYLWNREWPTKFSRQPFFYLEPFSRSKNGFKFIYILCFYGLILSGKTRISILQLWVYKFQDI